jgi:hypothetical protein
MPEITDVRARPGDNLERLPALYRAAASQDKTLTQLLEDEDPSHEWDQGDRELGAFGRVMQASGFRFKSSPSEGIWADSYEKIYESDEGRAILPELFNTIWRKTRNGGWTPQARPQQQRVIESGSEVLGTMFKPYTDAAGLYSQTLEPGIALSDLVAFNTAINNDTYRRAYLTDPAAADVRLLRIGEAADIPRASIRTSEQLIRLHKYGRAIEVTYEAVRRVAVDKVGLFIAKAALQVEADRVAQAIDVLLNGDGNSGTSADNFNQSTLDTGVVPTVKGLIAFKSKFRPPYRLTHLFAREAELVNLQMLTMPNSNPLLRQVASDLGFGALDAMQDLANGRVLYGQTDAVATGVYLGIDARYALERITEIGSDIQETTRFIERQTELMTFTENDGFGILDTNANKTWTMA